MLSIPVRLMLRPFGGYRTLASATPESEPGSFKPILVGVARFLFVVGCFVSITATGRFAPFELASAMISFSWLPVSHAIGLAVTLRVLAPSRSSHAQTPSPSALPHASSSEASVRPIAFQRAYALFLESLGPWLVVFLILSGCCLFAAQPARPIFALLFPLIVIGSVWSVVLLFAFFRAGLGLPRGRAFAATALFYVVMHAFVLGYYFAAGQLWPILPW